MTIKTTKDDARRFDLRTLDHFIAQGSLKAGDYEKHLKSLPDEEGNYDLCQIDEDSEDPSETAADEDLLADEEDSPKL